MVVMRRVGFCLLALLFCFGPADAASLQSEGVCLESQRTEIFSGPQQPIFAACTATANCPSGAITCAGSGSSSCHGVDQNCGISERGYVQCGSFVAYCPDSCSSNPANCDSLNQQYPGCGYTYWAAGSCCVPEFPSLGCPEEPCLQ